MKKMTILLSTIIKADKDDCLSLEQCQRDIYGPNLINIKITHFLGLIY